MGCPIIRFSAQGLNRWPKPVDIKLAHSGFLEAHPGFAKVIRLRHPVWRPVDLQSDAFSATPALRHEGHQPPVYVRCVPPILLCRDREKCDRAILHFILAGQGVENLAPNKTKCHFWQWVDEDKGTETIELKLSFLENEFNVYKVKTNKECICPKLQICAVFTRLN
ncbi:hypothetical protein LXL04_003127 [Taraxacum kok-saghyz]